MKPATSKNTILNQICNLIPRNLVPQLARKHGVDKKARGFSPWSHVVVCYMLQEGFEQMRQSIENVYDLTGKRSDFKSLLHQQGHGFPGEQRDVAYTFINTILNASS